MMAVERAVRTAHHATERPSAPRRAVEQDPDQLAHPAPGEHARPRHRAPLPVDDDDLILAAPPADPRHPHSEQVKRPETCRGAS
jgi:hypothetical protein